MCAHVRVVWFPDPSSPPQQKRGKIGRKTTNVRGATCNLRKDPFSMKSIYTFTTHTRIRMFRIRPAAVFVAFLSEGPLAPPREGDGQEQADKHQQNRPSRHLQQSPAA